MHNKDSIRPVWRVNTAGKFVPYCPICNRVLDNTTNDFEYVYVCVCGKWVRGGATDPFNYQIIL